MSEITDDLRITRAEIVSKNSLSEDAKRYISLLDMLPSLTEKPLYTCEMWGDDVLLISVNILKDVDIVINFYSNGKFESIYCLFGDNHQAIFENGFDDDEEEDDTAYEVFLKIAEDYRDAVEKLIEAVPYDIG